MLLPGSIASDDVTTRLHATLVEAFCYENDIHLLKVDNMEALRHNLAMTSSTETKNLKTADLSCAVIQVRKIWVFTVISRERPF